MGRNLLIVGAGIYALVASEIAAEMNCFDQIDFIDDAKAATANGIQVIGTMRDLEALSKRYSDVIVAIGNPEVRLSMLKRIREETDCRIVSLISPRAYISPTAQVMQGCIIEPMAVVHTGCLLCEGCIISAGAVVNHASMCCDGVHVDCNATIAGRCVVPAGTKVSSGITYKGEPISTDWIIPQNKIGERT